MQSNAPKSDMPANMVVNLYGLLKSHGISVWVDGGWAVDALLGEQTRPHADLDKALETKHVPKLRKVLEEHAFHEKPSESTRTWNFVLTDHAGHEIDVHVFAFDENGDGIYGPPENGDIYPADSLTGIGTINAIPVQCISVEWLVKFHTGYSLGESDFHDVRALCERFDIEPPDEYRNR